MSTQRTPPKPANSKLQQGKSVSEPDLASAPGSGSVSEQNVTLRNKRQRIEESPGTECNQFTRTFNEFKIEIMQMLASWKTDNDVRLSTWKAEQDAILTGLVRDMNELKAQCAQIQHSHLAMEQGLKFSNDSYEEMKTKLRELEVQKRENINLINQLEKNIQDLQLESRSATIEIRNIPLKPRENSDDLFSLVTAVGKTINIEVRNDNLRDVFRLPGLGGSPRPIVVEFNSVTKRNEFLSKVRSYNKERPVVDKLNTQSIGFEGEKKPIYVDEHLMPSKKKLFYDARALAKAKNFTCWNSYGRIFIRINPNNPNEKPIQIKSEKCLLSLAKKD